MRYFIIAGEPSGDQHAAGLMNALKDLDSEAGFQFLGGDQMSAIAGDPVIAVSELAIMGFTQVLTRLGRIRHFFSITRQAILDFNPDVVILVDYGGFNLRMARWASKRGFRVHYYIPPKVWAWNESRVKKLKAYTDQVFVIFPFEEEYFNRKGVSCKYVGNPLVNQIDREHQTTALEEKSIVLVPGSRRQEIKRILPIMLQVIPDYPDYIFRITAMSIHQGLYEELVGVNKQVRIVYDQMHLTIRQANAALVTSGTATLETALLNTPQVVCFRANLISFMIARTVIKVPYISLVNLMLNERLVPELIQNSCRPKTVSEELQKIIPGGSKRSDQLAGYQNLSRQLGKIPATDNLAALIIKSLKAH